MSPIEISLTGFAVLISLLSTSESSRLITVTLNQFSREDLIQECETLLVEGDRILMNGTVYFDSSLTDVSSSFSLMNKQPYDYDFNVFNYVSTKECKTGDEFFCEKRKNANIFDIYINIKASAQLSEGLLMLTVHYNNLEFHSNEVKLPKIYILSTALLEINGQAYSQMKENINLNESFIEICCKLDQFPCNSVIFPLFSPQMNGSKCIIIRPINEDIIKYTLGFIVCASSKYMMFNNMKIAVALNQSDGIELNSSCKMEMRCSEFIMLMVILGTLILAIIVAAIFIFMKVYRRHYNVLPHSETYVLNPTEIITTNAVNETREKASQTTPESATIPVAIKNSHGTPRYRGAKKKQKPLSRSL
ncbi:hypothetical protein Btru_041241 [Bulinus truncatus]|nr:hypothetical protein Btru_041241 [Bulinus truncatus]